MIIDLTPLFSGEVKELPLDYKEAVSGEAYERYFDGLGIDISGEVEITGRIYDMSAYMQLEITAKLPYRSQCCRCLKETEGAVICKIERVLSANEADGEEDDVIVYTDRKIDPEETVFEELSMAVPSKPLCRPDCKGLCPVCGHDLNDGGCEHAAED